MKTKNRFSLSRLFRNNKFLLVFSLLLAIVIWVIMSLSNTNESDTVITNIPIQINLSDEATANGLKIFSGNDQSASVTVKGNRVTLGSISSDDIILSAQTAGTISTSGTYALSLSARKVNTSDNFEIVSSPSPSVITVFVDHSKDATFEIENKLKYTIADGYHCDVTLSTEEVKVSGPQSEVSKIASVAIEGSIGGEIREDKSSEFDIKLYDNTGTEISNGMITLSEESVTANFSVLPEKEVPVKLEYKNKPENLNIDSFLDYSPAKILIAAPSKTLDKLESVSTEKIDFGKLSNKKEKLNVALDLPSKVVNLSESKNISVTLDLRSYKSRRINVSNKHFTVKGLSDDYTYSFSTDELNVQLKGPKSKLSAIKASNITCEIDASDIDGTTGSISLPAKISLNSVDSCWVHGEYKVNIYVTKK